MIFVKDTDERVKANNTVPGEVNSIRRFLPDEEWQVYELQDKKKNKPPAFFVCSSELSIDECY